VASIDFELQTRHRLSSPAGKTRKELAAQLASEKAFESAQRKAISAKEAMLRRHGLL